METLESSWECLYLCLHEVPREGYRIPPVLGSVVFPYRVLKEILGFFLSLRDVERGQNDGCDLQDCDDDNEEAVGGQEDARFLDGTAVAQETDDEDKCTGSDENVSTLLNHGGLCQFLQNSISQTPKKYYHTGFTVLENHSKSLFYVIYNYVYFQNNLNFAIDLNGRGINGRTKLMNACINKQTGENSTICQRNETCKCFSNTVDVSPSSGFVYYSLLLMMQ